MNISRKILSPLLVPLSLLYGFIVFIRNKLYDYKILRSHSFEKPVISVGNITVGGTGKTPHIEYIANLLKDEFQVACLSRGYKRTSKGFQLAGDESSAESIGDEPLQIQRKFPEVQVAVDADRVAGIRKLLEKRPGLDAILLDDAYQHRKVYAPLSILLIDYNRPIDKDFMLPFGDLREQNYEKRRANIIIISKAPKDLQPIDRRILLTDLKPYPYQSVFFTYMDYGMPHSLFYEEGSMLDTFLETDINDKEIILLTGIANSTPLANYLQETYTKNIRQLKYPDHYRYEDKDIKKIETIFNQSTKSEKIIITTEKDAMRLQKFTNIATPLKKAIFYIPIEVKFLNNRTDNFNQQIIDYVRKNKKHSELYHR